MLSMLSCSVLTSGAGWLINESEKILITDAEDSNLNTENKCPHLGRLGI